MEEIKSNANKNEYIKAASYVAKKITQIKY